MGTHENLARETENVRSSDRTFGIAFAIVFTTIAAFGLAASHAHAWRWLAAAVIFALAAWLRPSILAPLNRLWAAFGLLLHAIMSPLVLGLLYAIAVVPTGLVLRALGKDILRLRKEPESPSYWIRRESPGTTMTDQF